MAVITSVRPPFRNNKDKVAFAVHASILASGFVLTVTGRPAFADHALSSSLTQGDVGIDGWNEFDGEYAFVYRKRSKRILVKCLAMDDKLLVDAIAYGGTEPAHLEIEVGNYAGESREGDYSSQFKNLSKLVTDVQSEILDKLDGRSKPSSSWIQSSSWDWSDRVYCNGEHSYCTRAATSSSRAVKRKGIAISSIPQASQNRRRSSQSKKESSLSPTNLLTLICRVVVPPIRDGGYSDLHPNRGGFGDGSMFVGANDPRIYPQIGDRTGFMGPQPGVPAPGARFDPYCPHYVPGFEPGRFISQPPRRPGGGMHPDLEQFRGGSDFI